MLCFFEGCDTPGSGGSPKPAVSYLGPQPGKIAPGASKEITINDQWNGRIFNQNGKCGAKGEGCTMLEYNLGELFTRRGYITAFCFVSFHPSKSASIHESASFWVFYFFN